MNYEISNLCLANKIHMVTMLRLLLMRFIMASYEKKIWFENTRVSQKTTQPSFDIGLGSGGGGGGLNPFNILNGGGGLSIP